MRALLDVNVLIALHDPQHIHHAVVVDWFEAERQHGWATCPLTQNGCLRVMCQPSYTHPWLLHQIAPALSISLDSEGHAFWPDDIGLLDAGRLRLDHIHGHRQLADIYLLMLAVHRGGRLLTLDARIAVSAVVGAESRHLIRLLAT